MNQWAKWIYTVVEFNKPIVIHCIAFKIEWGQFWSFYVTEKNKNAYSSKVRTDCGSSHLGEVCLLLPWRDTHPPLTRHPHPPLWPDTHPLWPRHPPPSDQTPTAVLWPDTLHYWSCHQWCILGRGRPSLVNRQTPVKNIIFPHTLYGVGNNSSVMDNR